MKKSPGTYTAERFGSMKARLKKPVGRILSLCILVFVLESVFLAFILNRTRDRLLAEQHERARLNAACQSESIQKQLYACEEITEILAYSVVNTDGGTDFFTSTASELYEKYENIESIQLAPDGVVTMIYPESGNEAGKIDLFADEERGPIVRYGRDHHVVTVQGPIDLLQGGTGLIFRKPVYLSDGTFWGFAIVIEDTEDLVEGTMSMAESFGYSFALEKTEPVGDGTYETIGGRGEVTDPETESFTYGACTWLIQISPENGWNPGRAYTELLVGGIAIILLVPVLLFFVFLYRRKHKDLEKVASIDFLTGLTNRKGLSEWMTSYRTKHPDEPCTEVMLDIDNFKAVNDLHGHDAGDEALRVLARALENYVGDRGIAARCGGDEFCIVLKNMTAEQAAPFVENFGRNEFTYLADGKEDTFTVSIGYASFPDDSKDWKKMYLLADAALYAGKFTGKHACMHYDASIQNIIQKRQGVRIPEVAQNMPLPFLVCEDEGNRDILFVSVETLHLLGCRDFTSLDVLAKDRLSNVLDKESFSRLARGELQNGDLVFVKRSDGTKVAARIYLGRRKMFGSRAPIVMLFLVPEKAEDSVGKEAGKTEDG